MATRRPEIIIPMGEGGKPITINPQIVILIVAAIVLLVWLVRGGPAYTVDAGEEGVVLTFGKFTRISQPGFHFKVPWPIQTVEKVKVGEVKRLELGFRSVRSSDNSVATYQSFMDTNASHLLTEAQMLTGDENVVNCSVAVQYRVRSSVDYLFNYRSEGEVESALRAVSEAALRQAVGDHPIDDVLTAGKEEVQREIERKIQELATQYGMGVAITALQLQDVQPPREVSAAFRDVATAREEREKIINEARAYQSGQLPLAEGKGEKIRQEAQGYKESRIAAAQGAVSRFQAIAKQYEAAPEVTRTRLYLEAMSELLPKVRLTVVDEKTGVVNLKALGGRFSLPTEASAPAAMAGEGTEMPDGRQQ